ncbi:DsrE family protein [Streptomyces sp. B1I3]|uniref:DsrE family protein n=1 Tax=Streptomyces sp. B1I3 TaxID=3042264 RepID=UPI0027864C27|nr:DsrE family protein [Streptomyces sp. B1I3]MDQ0795478.1 sulfur relay (sulfurtransferase) complex TusBCD TusD component (DsrE family) [Streptomyces sp. B1I3]
MEAQPVRTADTGGAAASYFLIESKGNWAGPNAGTFLLDAVALAEAGHRVRVYLVEDGVLSAVGTDVPEIGRLAEAGVEVLVDDFSAAQRALAPARLSPHVRLAGMDSVAAALAEDDCRGVWH